MGIIPVRAADGIRGLGESLMFAIGLALFPLVGRCFFRFATLLVGLRRPRTR